MPFRFRLADKKVKISRTCIILFVLIALTGLVKVFKVSSIALEGLEELKHLLNALLLSLIGNFLTPMLDRYLRL